jgi:homocysteine S-methyltransferase
MGNLFRHSRYLTDGGLETDLIFNEGFELPEFAAIDLMRTKEGREGLATYYTKFLDIAARKETGFVLESPTWRASRDWIAPLGYADGEMEKLNRDAISLMKSLRDEYQDRIPHILISGCIGPRGDGYDPGTIMEIEAAADYHAFQVELFAEEGCDLTTAITMTNANEASGIAVAAKRADLPCVISFTVETDGRLPSGMTLGDAIDQVDSNARVVHYMVNCAHPTHFQPELIEGSSWLERIGGFRSNASKLSHAELDECEDLDEGNPTELAERHLELYKSVPSIKVTGGCCGTDEKHIAAIADAWADHWN